jgi:hypothetical protein
VQRQFVWKRRNQNLGLKEVGTTESFSQWDTQIKSKNNRTTKKAFAVVVNAAIHTGKPAMIAAVPVAVDMTMIFSLKIHYGIVPEILKRAIRVTAKVAGMSA